MGQGLEVGAVDVAVAIGNFLRAGDFDALATLDGLDEHGCVKERVVSSGIKPGHSTAQLLHLEKSVFEIMAIEVCDLQFATHRGSKCGGYGGSVAVIKIQAGDGALGFRL